MQDYKTVMEKAEEWNITPRHVQYLCRNKKIKGAIKRAGSWFIPDDAPIPVKNTKSNVKGFKYVGTRKKIFDTSIRLFMLKGFNTVSLRDIADNTGIRQSTIYNHFKSKQEILDTIYDFYCHYFVKDRTNLEDMERILQTENIFNIMSHIRYEFKKEYQQIMLDITRIIFQRISVDERAVIIIKSVIMDEGFRYVETIFKRSIEIGRIAPFDTRALAVFVNSIRIFTFYNWITDPSPDNMLKVAEDEKALYNYAIEFLSGLMVS